MTTIVAAVVFVVTAVALTISPTPYVAWTPGPTYNVLGDNAQGKPIISITGTRTYPTTGEIRLLTVSQTRVDSSLSLPEAMMAYLLPNRDVIPRGAVYGAGKSPAQVQQEDQRQMASAQSNALVAALRAAGQPVTELPQVQAVRVSGPSNQALEPGDLVTAIDNEPVTTVDEVLKRIQSHAVGQKIVIDLLRDGKAQTVTIDTVGSNSDGRIATIGVTWGTGYSYSVGISWGMDPEVGQGSGGLAFALAIYDKLTPDDLLGGRKVAATGTINTAGQVGVIGGIQEKMAGAEASGATVFLVPAGNCNDTIGAQTSMTLIKVATLSDSILRLQQLNDPARADQVPRC